MNRLRTFFFLLFLSASGCLTAQDLSEKNFTGYSTSDGLSDNTITGVAQDAAGYIWLSTFSGLNKYDGNQFRQYHSTRDSLSPASEEFWGLSWLDKERLVFYTTGLHIINTRTGERRNVFIPYADKQYQYKFNMIVSALAEDKGDLYVLTRSGFYHYDKNYKLLYRYDYYQGEKVAREHFVFGRELVKLDKNRVLIISINGLYIYDTGKKQIKKMDAADYPPLAEFLNYPGTDFKFFHTGAGRMFIMKVSSDTVVYINVAENKKIVSRLPFKQLKTEFGWRTRLIPVSDTLFYLTGHLSGFYKMRFYPDMGTVNLHPEKYFASYQCNTLLSDRDHNLWVATNRGCSGRIISALM